MEKGLLEKTGKPLSLWIDVVNNSGLEKHKAIVDFLKADFGLTHGYANFISLKARAADAGSIDDQDLLTNQYKGKEDLKPIYDLLKSEVGKLGDDIQIVPKKDSVSMVRKRQFALIKPATKTRIDLGLKLKGQENTGVLESSGPFGSMCTHRIRISSLEEVNSEVLNWIKESYERAG